MFVFDYYVHIRKYKWLIMVNYISFSDPATAIAGATPPPDLGAAERVLL